MDELTRELIGVPDSRFANRDAWSEATWTDRVARARQWRRDRRLVDAIRRWRDGMGEAIRRW